MRTSFVDKLSRDFKKRITVDQTLVPCGSKLKRARKSEPIMKVSTAIMKGHWKIRRNPKSSWSNFCSYVGMVVPFQHISGFPQHRSLMWVWSHLETGMIETSALVSTKNLILVTRSLTMRRRTATAKQSAARDSSASSFPVSLASNCKVAYTW